MNTIQEPLTEAEAKELVKQERILESGFIHVRDCAEALRIIRDQRLYRQFGTFQEYCEKKWGRERATINLLLQVSEQRKELGKNFANEKTLENQVKNASDNAVRALAKVPKRSRKRVFAEVLKNGKPTAAAIAAAALKKDPPPRKDPTRGKKGVSTEFVHPDEMPDQSHCYRSQGRPPPVTNPVTAPKTIRQSVTNPVTSPVTSPPVPGLKQRILDAVDAEISSNPKLYAGFEKQAQAIYAAIEAVEE